MFPLFTSGALNSILFGVYGNELRRLQDSCSSDSDRKEMRRQQVFVAGSIAGLIHSLIACPLELIKIRLQTQNCKSFCFLPSHSPLCMYRSMLYATACATDITPLPPFVLAWCLSLVSLFLSFIYLYTELDLVPTWNWLGYRLRWL